MPITFQELLIALLQKRFFKLSQKMRWEQKKITKIHPKKNRNVSAKIQIKQFLLFPRSDGISTLIAQHEPTKLGKRATCPVEKSLSHFFANFLATKSFRQPKLIRLGQKNFWASTCLGWKIIGPMGNCYNFVKTYKRSGQITKFQNVTAKRTM